MTQRFLVVKGVNPISRGVCLRFLPFYWAVVAAPPPSVAGSRFIHTSWHPAARTMKFSDTTSFFSPILVSALHVFLCQVLLRSTIHDCMLWKLRDLRRAGRTHFNVVVDGRRPRNYALVRGVLTSKTIAHSGGREEVQWHLSQQLLCVDKINRTLAKRKIFCYDNTTLPPTIMMITKKKKKTIWPNCRETEIYYLKQREVDLAVWFWSS